MKFSTFALMFFCIVYSCSSKKDASVISIITDKTEIKLNEVFKAKICFAYKDSIYPSFYIVDKEDTSLLFFQNDIGCALFEAVGRKEGKRIYNGYVEYSMNGLLIQEPFQLKYIVSQ